MPVSLIMNSAAAARKLCRIPQRVVPERRDRSHNHTHARLRGQDQPNASSRWQSFQGSAHTDGQGIRFRVVAGRFVVFCPRPSGRAKSSEVERRPSGGRAEVERRLSGVQPRSEVERDQAAAERGRAEAEKRSSEAVRRSSEVEQRSGRL